MSKEQLVLRLLSSVANIDSQRLRTGFLEELDFARIAPAMNALSEAPMYIDDTPNISAMELRTKARRLQAEAGLDLVIVDYLQLMQATTTNRDANRVQEVSEISRGLKALARELKVPVIALSQLSRQPEMRESKEPRLSDLRESGAIEQDADLVMFLWRDKERGARRPGRRRRGHQPQARQAPQRPHRRGRALVQEEARPASSATPASATPRRADRRRRLAAIRLRQPSYSKPILTSTRYSTISPSSTTALDFTTSTVWMLRTVFEAVATAYAAASLHDCGLVPTISRMMMTPTVAPLLARPRRQRGATMTGP